MADISINYKGTALASMTASGTKTLLTAGKYCEGDIDVVYDKPQTVCQIIEFTLEAHSAANVNIGTLSDEAYVHINDDNFSVSLLNTTPQNIVNNDDFRIFVSNSPNQPAYQGTTPQYGIGNRKVSTTVNVQNLACYYPPNSTNNSTSLGGIGKVWHDGKTLYYKSASYYFAAGTYQAVISW